MTGRYVSVDASPVGTGKTYRAIERAVTKPAKWLFAVHRIDGIKELKARIDEWPVLGPPPIVKTITSNGEIRSQSVRLEIEALPTQYAQGHVIVCCTHAALMLSNLERFCDWHLVVDEVPEVLQSCELGTKLDAAFFARNYILTRVANGWSVVSLTDLGRTISGSDLQQDDSHRHLTVFHRRVLASATGGPHVVCNLQRWEQMERSDVRWVWWSLFSLDELRAFRSVTFLGNGFMESVSAKMLRMRSPDVEWKITTSSGRRIPNTRRVRIIYFSETRRSSKSFFGSLKGQEQLSRIAEFVRQDCSTYPLIWSCNEAVKSALENHLPSDSWLKPKQAGTNRFIGTSRAAMFYAAKPSPEIRKVIEAAGVTVDDWIETNEWETILQFVTRISIRDPASAEDVLIYVFGRDQAAYLKRFFDEQPHVEASANWIDLGLDLTPGKCGPKSKTISPQEAEVRLDTRRKRKRDWQRQNRLQQQMILAPEERGAP